MSTRKLIQFAALHALMFCCAILTGGTSSAEVRIGTETGKTVQISVPGAPDLLAQQDSLNPPPSDTFIKAVGTQLREQGGNGPVFTPKGLVLTNSLVVESEFSNIGGPATPLNFDDDNHQAVKDELTRRFGNTSLLTLLQQNFIQEADILFIKSLGINTVTIPVYHGDFEDSSGNYTQFSALDRIVNFCELHGIYAIITLHGAPGGQFEDSDSGDNDLFRNTPEGAAYRARTIEFWEAVSTHYLDNDMILGYELLSDPSGALDYDPTLQAANGLWNLYDGIYQAIRGNGDEHLIIMSSIFDNSTDNWDYLPAPVDFGWDNLAYKFTTYAGHVLDINGNFVRELSLPEITEYIDGRGALSRQDEYGIPVFTDFNGLNNAEAWQYYLTTFEYLGWGSLVFCYKNEYSVHPNITALFEHTSFQNEYVDVSNETFASIQSKFQRFHTSQYTENTMVTGILKSNFLSGPVIQAVNDFEINQNQNFSVNISASHPSGQHITFTAQLIDGSDVADAGMRFTDNNNATARLSWTPFTGQAGTYTVVITAEDADGITDREFFNITVVDNVVIAQIL